MLVDILKERTKPVVPWQPVYYNDDYELGFPISCDFDLEMLNLMVRFSLFIFFPTSLSFIGFFDGVVSVVPCLHVSDGRECSLGEGGCCS